MQRNLYDLHKLVSIVIFNNLYKMKYLPLRIVVTTSLMCWTTTDDASVHGENDHGSRRFRQSGG